MPDIDIPDNEFDQLSRNDKFLQILDQTIQSNLSNEYFGVEQLAHAISMSRSQLYRRLHDINGKNASQYMREYRLKRALEMLKRDVASVSEIAYRVGFNSPTYFNKCFHDFYGFTPGSVTPIDYEDSEMIKPIYSQEFNEGEQSLPSNRTTNLRKDYKGDTVVKTETPEKPIQIPGKRKFIGIILSGILIITVVLIWKLIPVGKNAAKLSRRDRTIAVLPFKNLSPSPENNYFCFQMTEEIRTHLQRIKDISIKSRIDVDQYVYTRKSTTTLGTELGVSFILDGSVRKQDEKLRITVNFIDTKSGKQIWSNSYDGKYSEKIFEFQASVAKQVASSLYAVIEPEEQRKMDKYPTQDIIAYDYFIKGRYEYDLIYRTGQEKHVKNAHDFFEKALKIDPEFLYALNWQGETYIAEAKWDSARFYADKILSIDPVYSGAYMIKAECYLFEEQFDLAIDNYSKVDRTYPEYPAISALIGRAYRNKKNSQITALRYFQECIDSLEVLKSEEKQRYYQFAYTNIGMLFMDIGLYDYAEDYFQKASKIGIGFDQLNKYIWLLMIRSKYDEAIQFIDSIYNLGICKEACLKGKFHMYLLREEFEEAAQQVRLFTEMGTPFYLELDRRIGFGIVDEFMLAYLYKEMGENQEADMILGKTRQSLLNLVSKRKSWWIYRDLSLIYAMEGKNDETLKCLDEAIDLGLHLGWHDLIGIHPIYKDLLDNPEFKALVKKAQDEKAAIRAQVQEMVDSGEIDL